MVLYILGFVYIFISFVFRKKYNPFWGWLIVFIVMAFQSNVPGDYVSYLTDFIKIAADSYHLDSLQTEKGWNYINYIFSKVANFKVMIFCISLVEYLALASFTKRYALRGFAFLSALIFYFSTNMMLFQMKGIRQGLAVELSLMALMFIDLKGVKRGGFYSILLLILSYFIHSSSAIFFPFVFIAILMKKYDWSMFKSSSQNFIFPSVITSIYVLLYIFKVVAIDFIQPLLLGLSLGGSEGYFGEMEFVNYNILITVCGAIFTFAVAYVMQVQNGFLKFLSLLTLIALFMEMFFYGMGNLFRLTLYVGIVSLVALPNVSSYLCMKNHKIAAWIFAGLVIAYFWRGFITQTIYHSYNGFDNYMFLFF